MLRALAAVMVFLFHATAHYQAMGGEFQFFYTIGSVGYSGVDIFFVISGFVVAHTTLHQARTLQNAWTFSKRRLLRIYLGYWPFFALTLCITALYDSAALADMQLLPSFLLATIDARGMVLFVSWSLSFELLFYLIASASFAIPATVAAHVVRALGAGILLLMIWTFGQKHGMRFVFLSCFLEFLAGMLIYIHREVLTNRWWIAPLALVTLTAFLMGGHLHATNDSVRIFTFGVGAVALVMLAVLLEQSRVWIASKRITSFGDASYTLYLLHPALLTVFFFWRLRDFLAQQPILFKETGFFLYLTFGMWAAKAFYGWLERPLYKWAISARTVPE
jgi:peptidoglycan/LPS O-acetylase OafA/YrhL